MDGPDAVDRSKAGNLLQQLHQSIERVSRSEQGLEREMAALRQGYQTLSESMKVGSTAAETAALDTAARTLGEQLALFGTPLLATLTRPNSPMRPDELVPSILGLEMADCRRCVEGIRAFAGDSWPSTVSEAIRLITVASENGIHVSDVEEKLRLFKGFIQEAG
jgi:hypothetical protein